MAAIGNKIYIGSVAQPDFVFENGQIDAKSLDYEENVDLIASELSIDVLNVIVKYAGEGNLTAVKYGTPIWHYQDGNLQHKFYIKQIQRIARDRYKINSISPVGILNKQYHKGGVYTGVTFSSLMSELIDGVLPYTYDTDVGETKIFGWLPYDTKRKNLHQVLFAENISIVKNSDGDMHFTFLKPDENVTEIPQSRIFLGGSIKYPSVATSVRLSEHSYQAVDTVEPIVLVDNSDKTPANNKLFVFDTAPIIISTIQVSGDLTIVERGVNYVIVTGQGVVTGIPYYDKVSTVEKTHNSGGESYSVSINDATLVTGINSENVAQRLMSYYTSSEIVNADLKISGEKCGRIYQFVDMFGDTVRAFLTKMASKVSSFVRAKSEFITGYVPDTFGNNYTHWAYVRGNGHIKIQDGTKIARFVIIGGGAGGSSGLKGKDDLTDLQAGGVGGAGGDGGNGGRIREVVLRNPAAGIYACSVGTGGVGGTVCTSNQSRELGEDGNPSTVTAPNGTVYSSADNSAYLSRNGIKNLFTEDVYAKKGRDGCKGGNGGRGSVSGNGEAGEDVVWNGVTYKGGLGGKGYKFNFTHVDQAIANGGAGGSGAMPYQNGGNGGSVSIEDYWDDTSTQSGYQAYERVSFKQGEPASTAVPSAVVQTQNYGDGGDGGHGGAGRGGFGSANELYQTSYNDPSTGKKTYLKAKTEEFVPEAFESSDGGAGNSGKGGIIVCYADKPLEVDDPQYEATTLGYDGYYDGKMHYFFQ